MYVSPITQNNRLIYRQQSTFLKQTPVECAVSALVEYAPVPFYGIVKTKSVTQIFNQKQSKLLRQIDEILAAISPETINEDEITASLKTIMAFTRNLKRRQDALWLAAEQLDANKALSPMQKLEQVNRLKKEYRKLENARPEFKDPPKPDPKLAKIDYELLNKFKSAILSENYDLKSVFLAHYAGLETIETVDELKKHYPKISIPQDPQEVIARKIVATLPREFYEIFDEYFMAQDYGNQENFAMSYVQDLCRKHAPQFGLEYEDFFKLIAVSLSKKMLETFEQIKHNDDNFASIPQKPKYEIAPLTRDDKILVFFDYDDYVLNALRRMYLKGIKPNELGCKLEDGLLFSLASIQDSCYKFDKVSEKIKGFIKLGDELKKLQRDYDKFDFSTLKSRLMFYANQEIGNDETVLENIINFDGCEESSVNISKMKDFLRELDRFHDKELTKQDTLIAIEQKNLYPEIAQADLEEKINAAEKFKAEQKKIAELNKQQEIFDNTMNILYSNNMNTVAATLSSHYRPASLTEEEIETANYINDLISGSVNEQNLITNKVALESKILRWNTYNQYKQGGEQLFKEAVQYATTDKLDIERAGQYIINMNILNDYPNCTSYHKYGDVIHKIMERTGGDKQVAIVYLNRLDEYLALEAEDKTHLSKIVEIFSLKDNVDKAILKYIVENEYIKVDTNTMIGLQGNGEKNTKAAICASAKQQVFDKYRFPGCLDFLLGFEEALNSTANNVGTSGIKQTGRNNRALTYKIELKLYGENDRLFSSKNDFRFDIYSEKGLH